MRIKFISVSAAFLVLAIILTGCGPHADDALEDYIQRGTPVEAKICEVKDDRAAIITIISDDGNYESGVILNSLAREFNIHVTVSGFVNNLNEHLDEWQQIEEEGFIEVMNHSYSHLKINEETNPSYAEIFREYVDAKKYFEENFNTPSFCFVTPNNATTDTGYQILQENEFIAVRQGQRGQNSLSPNYGTEPGEWLNLMTRGIGDIDTTAERNAWVDTAIQDHSWLIEMWHDISPNGDGNYQPISTSMAREHLGYIAKKQASEDIWIAPFTQAVSYIYKKQNLSVTAWRLQDRILVQIEPTTQNLPWDEFNAPLSIRIELPEGWDDLLPIDSNCTVDMCDDPSEVIINTNITSGVLLFTHS